MYFREGREGMGAAGDYHDYSGGYLPELVPSDILVSERLVDDPLPDKPVVVFVRGNGAETQPTQAVVSPKIGS